jgi:hypothetical protein
MLSRRSWWPPVRCLSACAVPPAQKLSAWGCCVAAALPLPPLLLPPARAWAQLELPLAKLVLLGHLLVPVPAAGVGNVRHWCPPLPCCGSGAERCREAVLRRCPWCKAARAQPYLPGAMKPASQ